MNIRIALQASACAMALALAGCGGGGGGSVGSTPPAPSPAPAPTPTPTPTPTPAPTPTPTPTPPPTGANDDLLPPLDSETFANIGALGTISVPTSGGIETKTLGQAQLAFVYNAGNQSYTASDSSGSRTWLPSEIDQAQSSSLLTTYAKVTQTAADYLSLTRTGTGAGQTRYVGAGFWQQQVNGAATVEGRFTAFTYGATTPASAVPRSGLATFDVTLFGAGTIGTLINSIYGTGRVNVDFATGIIAASGRFGETVASPSASLNFQWGANALLSSTANSFSGTSSFDNYGSGNWRGAFYGPGAQEVGGTLAVGNTSGGGSRTLVAAMVGGRGALAINQYNSFPAPAQVGGAIFATTSASLAAQLDGSGRVVSTTAGPRLIGVYLPDPALQPVTYSADGQITAINPSVTGLSYIDNRTFQGAANPFVFQSVDTRTSLARVDQAIFGFPLAFADVPRTGTASFNVGLSGVAAVVGRSLESLTGGGAVDIDFATGRLTTLGNFQISDRALNSQGGPGVISDSGTWTGSAQMSSSQNAFTGTLALDGTRDFSGNWYGLFFGTGATDIASVLELGSSDGARIAGRLTGQRGTGAGASQTPLRDLTASATLQASNAQHLVTPSLSPSQATAVYGAVTVTYDPANGTYRLRSDPATSNNGGVAIDRTLTQANVDTAASDARFTAYRTPEFAARIFRFDGTNPAITLSYTSFATLTETVQDPLAQRERTVQHFIPFGGQTPAFQMPRTGTANYSGVVFGAGYNGATQRDATLSGTSAFAVNFGAGTASMVLALSATDVLNGATSSLGNVTFGGNLGGFCPGGCPTNAFLLTVAPGSGFASNGSMNGFFYGPNAAEFGAAFKFDVPSPNGQSSSSSTFAGVTVGKRD